MKKIARHLSIVTALAIVLGSTIVVIKRPAPTDRQTNVAELRGEIQRLQAKVGALEDRIDNLQKAAAQNPTTQPFILQVTNTPQVRPPFIQIPGRQPAISGNFADPNHPPKIWGEGECNGWKYYVIPLSQTTADVSSTVHPVGLAGLPGAGYERR